MTATLADAFADTVFWIALVVRADQYHLRARAWSQRVSGRLVTTDAVPADEHFRLAGFRLVLLDDRAWSDAEARAVLECV